MQLRHEKVDRDEDDARDPECEVDGLILSSSNWTRSV